MRTKATALLLGFLLLAGCRRAELPGVDVIFSIGDGTRLVDTGGEGSADSWTLLLYRDGQLAECGTSSGGASIQKRLAEGGYTAYAVVNPPTGFRPEDYPAVRDLEEASSSLPDNAPGRLVMAGSRTVDVPVPGGETQRIGVDRLVCKAGVRRISVAFTDPLLADRPFHLKALYLTNCYRESRYGHDLAASDILSDNALWHNPMGFHSDTRVDGLLAETGIDAPVTTGSPHTQEHYFYYYPNPLPETLDTRSETWTRRRTRLVIEAEIDGRTYYYPVTLPASSRNRTYIIEEAVIRKLGSRDPEKDEPGAIDVSFSISTDDWSPTYNVSENS